MQGAAMGEEDPGAGPLGGNPNAIRVPGTWNPGARYLNDVSIIPSEWYTV